LSGRFFLPVKAGGSRRLVLKTAGNIEHGPDPEGRVSAKWLPVFRRDHAPIFKTSDWRLAVDVQEVRKLDAYLKRVFGNPKIRVVPRPKKDDSAEVYIGEEFIGVLFVDDEDDDRSFQFQMAILEDDLVE
jgi:hypothetical protein